jgi:hypothetical protein
VAGLNARDTTFAALPPHFKCWNEELQGILDLQYPMSTNPIHGKRLLTRMLLASLVYHRDEIKNDLKQAAPDHPLFRTAVFTMQDEQMIRVKAWLYTSAQGDTMPIIIGERPIGQMVPCGLPVYTRTMAMLEAERQRTERLEINLRDFRNEMRSKLQDLATTGLVGVGVGALKDVVRNIFNEKFPASAPPPPATPEPPAEIDDQPNPPQQMNSVQMFMWADAGAKTKTNQAAKFRALPANYRFPDKVDLIECYKMFHSAHTIGCDGVMVRKLLNISPCQDIKSKKERGKFKRGKAVVQMMDFLLDLKPAYKNQKQEYSRISMATEPAVKTRAQKLLQVLAKRGTDLFIEKVFDATDKRLRPDVACNYAYDFLARIREYENTRSIVSNSSSSSSSSSSASRSSSMMTRHRKRRRTSLRHEEISVSL